ARAATGEKERSRDPDQGRALGCAGRDQRHADPQGCLGEVKLKYFVIGGAALILVPLAVAQIVLRASLPRLDGRVDHMEVLPPVSLDRDALGVPTIEAANRTDLAYALGFVHGQDRFFEMDLSRRLAAGELSEVFGPVALEQDKRARLFRFRQIARAALQQ